jgi:hypothetical protein
VQIASPQKAIIAKCNSQRPTPHAISLILKDLLGHQVLACRLLQLPHKQRRSALMNSALLLSNAIALAVLLGFHFAPENGTESVAQRTPHYLQLQKAPQLAVLNDQRGFASQDVSQEKILRPAPASERLVF